MGVASPASVDSAQAPRRKLLDQVSDALVLGHYSEKTREAYVAWVRRFVPFHGKRHPETMGAAEVAHFLSSLAVEREVSASTQNQALAAILFLYAKVLRKELGDVNGLVHARRPVRLPVVMTRSEVATVLNHLEGTPKLMAALLYGAGLRLLECARLRVKDVDFERQQLVVRRGKGQRDRITPLPKRVTNELREHVKVVAARCGNGRTAAPSFA